jgi:membrane fusion protein (multidrug efflux system)
MIKRFLIAFVLLAIVCGGIVYFNMFRDQAIQSYFANMPRPALTVSTETVEPVTWTPGIEAIGTVNARSGVDLTVETTGIVNQIKFRANEKVARDQILVQMDDAVQRADLEASKAQAALDQQTLERALELQKKGVGSGVTVESASAAAATSAATVAKLQAVLDQKQLKAPFGGTMGIPKIDEGQYLAPGTIVATLQDLDTMRADFTVPEQDLGKLKIGQTVRLGVDQATWPFSGRITGIDPKVDPATRLVSVRAEVANPEGRLSPGQFVQLRVELPEESDIIAVIQTAVVSSLYGDYVYLVVPEAAAPAAQTAPAAPAEGGEPAGAASAAPAEKAPGLVTRQVFVKTGRHAEGRVEILSGVSAGDVIVTAGQNRLSNGSPVAIDNSVTPDQQAASR